MAARLKERYQKDVAPQIAKEFGIGNPMAVPRVQKVVINMGMGEAIANAKLRRMERELELRGIRFDRPNNDWVTRNPVRTSVRED